MTARGTAGKPVLRELTAGPYTTERPVDTSGFATLDDFNALAAAVSALPHGSWREIARLVREPDAIAAQRRFKRQCDLLKSGQREKLDQLTDALGRFGSPNELWSLGPGGILRTPVQDISVAVGLEHKFARADSEEARGDA